MIMIFFPFIILFYLFYFCGKLCSSSQSRLLTKLENIKKHVMKTNFDLIKKHQKRFDIYVIDLKDLMMKNDGRGNNKFMKKLKSICENDISYLELPLI